MSEEVRVADVVVGPRIRKNMGDLKGLAESMAATGLIEPIVLDDRNQLMAGQRRLKAAQQLGWEWISAVRLTADGCAVEWDENEVRKDFTPAERKAIADAALPAEKKAAAARIRRGGALGGAGKARKKSSPVSQETGLETATVRAAAVAAQKAGWSEATLFRFSKVEEAHRTYSDNPRISQIYESVCAGSMGVLPAYNAVRAVLEDSNAVTPIQRRSTTTDLHRLQKLQERMSGIAMSMTTFDCEGGDEYRRVLELILKDLSVIRREVRRLVEGRAANV